MSPELGAVWLAKTLKHPIERKSKAVAGHRQLTTHNPEREKETYAYVSFRFE
jgi:hypothetical protein